MQPKRVISFCSRVAILMWASLWMLAAPLFHVHPEADHRHGEVGHVHGGTVHTVWSPDLDCEYNNHEQATSGHTQLAHSSDGHAEFGLSLLTDSTDRKSLKPFLTLVLWLSPIDVVTNVEQSVRRQPSITAGSSSAPFIHTIASRGPPDLLA
jgi:hypothetical protein